MSSGLSRFLGCALFALLLSVAATTRAEGGAPISLQVQLVARLASFDRNFAARAGRTASVLVVKKSGDATSTAESSSLSKAFSETSTIAGLPVKVDTIDFSDAAALSEKVRKEKIAIVYFTSGLEGEMKKVANALSGADVITVGTTAKHAENGAVVGIGVEEARPKLVVNAKSAKAQNVTFKAELLKLARVID